MKAPRISLATIGVTILILAINFAIVRAAVRGNGSDVVAIFALLLLPMIDVLLINAYRLRRRSRRTAGRIGFTAAGAAGTIALFVTGLIAPEPARSLLDVICRAVAQASIRRLNRLVGNAALASRPAEMMLIITFEILVPIALSCTPPLLVAVLGGWLARRAGAGRPLEGATIG